MGWFVGLHENYDTDIIKTIMSVVKDKEGFSSL